MMTPDVIKQAALITGRIVHQGTGKPLVGRIRITAREVPLVDKVLEDGTFALSGDLELLFPKLATQDYQVNLTIRADSPQFRKGFVEHELPVVTIPMGSNFDPEPPIPPDPLIDMGTIALMADAINVRGRVYDARPDQNVFAVRAEIYSSHPINSPVNRSVQVVQTNEMGPQRVLTAEAPAGQQTIRLDNRSGLVLNQVLRIGAGSTLEYGVITNPTPTAADTVILRDNLAYRHFLGQSVQAVNMLPLSTPIETELTRATNPKDRFLLLKTNKDFVAGSIIEIAGSTPTREYQVIDPLLFLPIVGATVEIQSGSNVYSTTTDALGRYQLDNRIILAPAQIRCSAATFKTQTRTLLIDFGKLINEEYFRLAPP